MTPADFSLHGSSDLARQVLVAGPTATKILLGCGVAPDTTDDFNELISEYLRTYVAEIRNKTTLEMELCAQAGYALGVAVGMRLAGGKP